MNSLRFIRNLPRESQKNSNNIKKQIDQFTIRNRIKGQHKTTMN